MKWFRWFFPRPPTQAQLMVQMKNDVHEMRERPVAYYRSQAAWWKRRSRGWLVLLAFLTVVALLVNSRWFTAFYMGLAFWQGSRWQFVKEREERAAIQAWEAENEETVNAMREAGLLDSPRDLLVVMRDADPPPGFDRKEWLAQHDRLLAEWDRRHGGAA